ncbi:MAG: hypothetical protein PHO27_10220 [Sulfuricurvum sp.]|nr:hypothetical protein [Sulfuricurvum sp.]
MNFLTSFFNKLIKYIRCFEKHRYGYLDTLSYLVPEGKKPLTLILSPDLYRICIVSLNVSSTKEALRYAPSYFDFSDTRIRYGAYKLDNGRYLMSACEPDSIRTRLEESGIPLLAIKNFILAQEVFESDALPITLKNGSVLVQSDGVVVRLSERYVTTAVKHDIESWIQDVPSCLSPFSLDMEQVGSASKKTLIITALLSGVIVINLLIQGIMCYRDRENISNELEQMKVEKHLPSTQMELHSLTTSWEKKESEQIKMRKIFAAFSKLPLETNTTKETMTVVTSGSNNIVLVPGSQPGERNLLLVSGNANSGIVSGGEYVSSLKYDNNLISFSIVTSSKNRAEELKDIVSKSLKTDIVTVKDNLLEGSVQ